MSRLRGRVFLTAVFLSLVTTNSQAASDNKTMKLKDVALGKVVQVGNLKFVKVEDNLYLKPSVYHSPVTQDFVYTGDIQEFITPCEGSYYLEVYGAQGSYSTSWGTGTLPKGGYSSGRIILTANRHLYVGVGATGLNSGYNGGTPALGWGGGGGGATHIAIDNNRGVLANYEDYKNEVLIVAGGGGGNDSKTDNFSGATGGGLIGGNGTQNATGGTQTAGGSGYASGTFGQGALHYHDSDPAPGGGGGWYGGGSPDSSGFGGGGSGYIGGVSDGVTLNGRNEGNGSARITYVCF